MKMIPACSMLLVLMMVAVSHSLNISITEVLSNYPGLTTFRSLLQRTGVVNEIQERHSITLLVAEDSVLDPVVSKISQSVTGSQLADVLRYHVLLEYEGINNLKNLPNKTKMFTTLFQTTGRAIGNGGSLNISNMEDGSVEIGWPWKVDVFGSKVLTGVKAFPYNLSIVAISRVLVPYGILPPSLMHEFLAPEPPVASPVQSPGEAPGPAHAPRPAQAPLSRRGSGPGPAPGPAPAPAAAALTYPPIGDIADAPDNSSASNSIASSWTPAVVLLLVLAHVAMMTV